MPNKTEFIKWFNEVASPEEVMKIFLFCNDLLGTNFDVENVQLLNNSLYKVLSLNSNKDDILNWLEDQDLTRITRIAEAINDLEQVKIFKDFQVLTVESFIYRLECSNTIDSTLLRKAIRRTLIFSLE